MYASDFEYDGLALSDFGMMIGCFNTASVGEPKFLRGTDRVTSFSRDICRSAVSQYNYTDAPYAYRKEQTNTWNLSPGGSFSLYDTSDEAGCIYPLNFPAVQVCL